MKDNIFIDLTETEKKAVILTLTSIFGSEFDVERINSKYLDNSSIYNISAKDGSIETKIEFGNKETDSSEALKDVLGFLHDIMYDSELKIESDAQFRISLMKVLNRGIQYMHHPEIHTIFDYYDGDMQMGTILKNTMNGSELYKNIYTDASMANGEGQALSLSMLLLSDFMGKEQFVGMSDVHIKLDEYADEYMLNSEDMFEEDMDWMQRPYAKGIDKELEKKRARLATIALASDNFDSILSTRPSFNYELGLWYSPKKSNRANYTYFHSREGREVDTDKFRYDLLSKANNSDFIYKLFGKSSDKMSLTRENKLLSEIYRDPYINRCENAFKNEGLESCLQDANYINGHTLLNAIILNLYMLDGIHPTATINKELDDTFKKFRDAVAHDDKHCFTDALDRNYDLVLNHPEVVIDVIKYLRKKGIKLNFESSSDSENYFEF